MADNRTKEQRSQCMKRIKSKDTKPELTVRRFLHSKGFRYSLHNSKLPGKPDLTLKKYKTVIFVHGCFWHSHKNCKNAKTPKSNKIFWSNKILRNIERDKEAKYLLKKQNWKVITVWECELKRKVSMGTLEKLIKELMIREQMS